MEARTIFKADNKEYTLQAYSSSNIIILQVYNLVTGTFYKKNIKTVYDPEFFFKVQKTQLKIANDPVEFVRRIEADRQNNNFCRCLYIKLFAGLETIKEV